MKNFYSLIIAIALSMAAFSGKAQITPFDPNDIVAGAQADINYLANGYLKPFGNALAVGLNNGWYQTAKPHKLGRFDIMFLPSLVFVPDQDQTFTINNSALSQLELVNGTSASAPTMLGDNVEGPALRFKGTSDEAFRTPNGAGISFLPVAMAQVGVGLVKNTDLVIRYLPTLSLPFDNEGSIGMFGFGVKHDVLQWLPADKAIPIDLSVMFGYTSLEFSMGLDDGSGNDDQELVMKSQGYTFRAIVSKKLAFFTPYLGVGFNSAKTDINVNGTYTYETQTAPGLPPASASITDPVSIVADDAGGFVANVGFRLKVLWALAISADYTLGAYNSANMGLGFSIDF